MKKKTAKKRSEPCHYSHGRPTLLPSPDNEVILRLRVALIDAARSFVAYEILPGNLTNTNRAYSQLLQAAIEYARYFQS